MLNRFRGGAAIVIVSAWVAVPATRGTTLAMLIVACCGYLAAMALAQRAWVRVGWSLATFFGVAVMADAAALAWASYGVAGTDSPLRLLLLLQLITVSLIGSFRLGLKLALFQVWMVLGAVYLQELGIDALGGEGVPFGSPGFRTLALEVVFTVLVAAVTTGFAAVNERELRRRRSDVEELADLTMRLDEAQGPAEISARLLEGIADLHRCPRGVVMRRTSDGSFAVLAAHGLAAVPEAPILSAAAPLVDAAVTSKQSALLAHRDGDGDAIVARFPADARLALVPVPVDDDAAILIVEQPAGAGCRMTRRTLGLLERYAAHAAIVMRNAELLEKVRSLATTDGLTGLPNRRHLDDALERACAQVARHRSPLGLLMIDVDHFKRLNDTHGHQVGDDVLRHVAKVLDAELRAGDMVARYGGEEFTVVMPGAHGDEVRAAADRLRSAIERASGPVAVTVSVGAAWAPEHGCSRDALVSAADGALYEAKEAGRNRVAFPPTTEPVVFDVLAS